MQETETEEVNAATSLLHQAIENGDLKEFKELLEQDINIESRDREGDTALMCAYRNGKLDVVKLLVEKGAELWKNTELSDTLLHIAAEKGDTETIQWLIEQGHPQYVFNEQVESPLCIACKYNHLDAAKLLVEEGAKHALHCVARSGNTEMIKWLIDEKGIHVDEENDEDETPLIYAIGYGQLNAAKLLVDKGANLGVCDEEGCPPLTLAATTGQTDIIEWLIDEKGFDVNAVECHGCTPLFLACEWRSWDAAKVLLKKGADPNVTDKEGNTLLHTRALGENPDMIQWLVTQHELDLNATNKEEATPLERALVHRANDAAERLLDLGAKPIAKCYNADLPESLQIKYLTSCIVTALKKPDKALLQELLKKSCDSEKGVQCLLTVCVNFLTNNNSSLDFCISKKQLNLLLSSILSVGMDEEIENNPLNRVGQIFRDKAEQNVLLDDKLDARKRESLRYYCVFLNACNNKQELDVVLAQLIDPESKTCQSIEALIQTKPEQVVDLIKEIQELNSELNENSVPCYRRLERYQQEVTSHNIQLLYKQNCKLEQQLAQLAKQSQAQATELLQLKNQQLIKSSAEPEQKKLKTRMTDINITPLSLVSGCTLFLDGERDQKRLKMQEEGSSSDSEFEKISVAQLG